MDERAIAGDDGADRTRKALGQRHHHGVHRRAELGRRNAQRDDRIEETRPVEVQRDAALVGDGRHPLGVGDVERQSARGIDRVLDRDERRDRLVDVLRRIAECVCDVGRVEAPVRPGLEPARRRADEHRVRALLAGQRVRGRGADDLATARHPGEQRRRHCPWCPTRRTGRPPCRAVRRRAPRAR